MPNGALRSWEQDSDSRLLGTRITGPAVAHFHTRFMGGSRTTNGVKTMPDIIPKAQLEIGAYYRGKCRNASIARWNGTKFIYRRHKFTMVFFDDINHPEDDDGFDLFKPYSKEYDVEDELPLEI